MCDDFMDVTWNPWHGCHKLSAGCVHCYVYRMDKRHDREIGVIRRTGNFMLPVMRNRAGTYKIPSGTMVYTCFTSDFFLEEADAWRQQAWQMIKARSDLQFLFITKRIDRFYYCIPSDWGDGYDNVHICCTVENQDRADYRLPIFREVPVRKKSIVCEPLLERIDLSDFLGDWVQEVLAGGESGNGARICDYDWVLDLYRQCREHHVAFTFRQTGARLKKDGKVYHIPRQYQFQQARKAGLEDYPE